ncbi:DUF262 domain-containing protein [Algibacter sp. 2305UL17-15]|uniref:DUF262 domain-containing protein n=1 Tax=Algibacter sp. 2305UL17-15 TaxID=3231268 RepID=UPI003458DBC5
MENKVYYGEYTLHHWITLILKKNLILPEYQRHFVWDEKKVAVLIESLKEKQFVPPILIGSFKDNENIQNLILDGQQRLTSILLAYLGLFPDENTFKNTLKKLADENDGLFDEEDADIYDNVIEWRFDLLTKKGRTKKEILKNLVDGNYKKVDLNLNESFFKNTFLGFSYLVPDNQNEVNQQKYYSSVFRNINIQGQTLLPQESRASLYFLDKDLSKFFVPDFISEISMKNTSYDSKIDFVRYLSLLSQYYIDENPNNVAKRFGRKTEEYYEKYIYSVTGETDSNIFEKFENIFSGKKFETSFEKVKKTINDLNLEKEYYSIIDLDLYFFGLIYLVVFKNKVIDVDKKDELKEKINNKIESLKNTENHKSTPGALKYLRERIRWSILIYKRYLKDE